MTLKRTAVGIADFRLRGKLLIMNQNKSLVEAFLRDFTAMNSNTIVGYFTDDVMYRKFQDYLSFMC